jgi:3-methyladenine DNA glycosylase AlkD
MDLRKELFENQDLKYKDFHKALVPNVDENKLIGVRVPILRKIAKQALNENAQNLCEYYEERMVKGFTIGLKNCSLEEHLEDLKEFVPLIDNWGVCDSCCSSFKFTKKYRDEMFDFICSYIGKGEYETRFAVIMLMDYYLIDEYIERVLQIYTSIKSDKYYVNMAVGWALSMAFVNYSEKVIDILSSGALPQDVHNKTIQKIRESRRVDSQTKQYINTFKKK